MDTATGKDECGLQRLPALGQTSTHHRLARVSRGVLTLFLSGKGSRYIVVTATQQQIRNMSSFVTLNCRLLCVCRQGQGRKKNQMWRVLETPDLAHNGNFGQ